MTLSNSSQAFLVCLLWVAKLAMHTIGFDSIASKLGYLEQSQKEIGCEYKLI